MDQKSADFANKIYTRRFSQEEDQLRWDTWRILGREFFQRYIKPESTVLDIGAGDGLFITNITAGKRMALDMSEHCLALAKKGIKVIIGSATEFSSLINEPVDVIFMSNFLEHMTSKSAVLEVLAECHKVLAKNGKVLILQPNIKYTGPAYWDYIDHHVALTDESLKEALEISGFRVYKVIPRFLPYTAKSRLGRLTQGKMARHLVEWYLKFPILWRIFGAQSFIAARVIK